MFSQQKVVGRTLNAFHKSTDRPQANLRVLGSLFPLKTRLSDRNGVVHALSEKHIGVSVGVILASF